MVQVISGAEVLSHEVEGIISLEAFAKAKDSRFAIASSDYVLFIGDEKVRIMRLV
jgi:hypothetical protein